MARTKKIGYGSLSIVFFILAVLSSVKITRTFCFEDILLRAFGISPWSNGYHRGLHNTVFLSFGFLIPGLSIGKVFDRDWGAGNNRKVNAFFLIIFLLTALFLFPLVIKSV